MEKMLEKVIVSSSSKDKARMDLYFIYMLHELDRQSNTAFWNYLIVNKIL